MPVLLKATCDTCGETDELELEVRFWNYSPSSGHFDVDETLKGADWSGKAYDGEVFCPECTTPTCVDCETELNEDGTCPECDATDDEEDDDDEA